MSVLNQFKPKFLEKNPKLDVEIMTESFASYKTKLKTLTDNGQSPDIIQVWPGDFVELKKNEYVIDLNQYFKKDNIVQNEVLFGETIKMTTLNGKLLAVPAYIDNMTIYYNKKWFDDAKVPYPTENWTWEQFLDIAKKLQTYAADPKKYGSIIPFQLDYIEPLVMGKGGSYFSPDGGTTSGFIDGKPSIEAFKWVADLIRVHKLSPVITGKTAYKSNDWLKNGTAAMIMNWSSFANFDADIRKGLKEGAYGIVGLPKFQDGKRANTAQMYGLAIPAKSNNKEEAWSFIRDLTIKPLQATQAMSDNGFIGTKALVKALEETQKDPIKGIIFNEFNYVQPNAYFKSANWFNIMDKNVDKTLLEFINSDAPVEGMLASIAGVIDTEVKKSNPQ